MGFFVFAFKKLNIIILINLSRCAENPIPAYLGSIWALCLGSIWALFGFYLGSNSVGIGAQLLMSRPGRGFGPVSFSLSIAGCRFLNLRAGSWHPCVPNHYTEGAVLLPFNERRSICYLCSMNEIINFVHCAELHPAAPFIVISFIAVH